MFTDSTEVKIGRILFEKRNARELHQIAYDLRELYDESNHMDVETGTMAIQIAVAAYFEGSTLSAGLVGSDITVGTGYCGYAEDALAVLRVFYFEAGAEVNGVSARQVARAYEEGVANYIMPNSYLAAQWDNKAAEMGEVNAQFSMGVRYYEGNGTEINVDKAIYWWTKAAEQDHVNSQFNLGVMYDGGNSSTVYDPVKAGYWLERAARNGDQKAAEKLQNDYIYNKFRNIWQKRG